jgi:hypothetical protein
METKGISKRTLRKLPANMQVKIQQASAISKRRTATSSRPAVPTKRETSTISRPAEITSTQSKEQNYDAQIKQAFNYTLGDLIGYDQVDALNMQLKNSVWRAVDDSAKIDNSQTVSFDIANGSTTYYPGKLVRIDKTNFLKAGPQDFNIGANQRAPMTFRIMTGGSQRAGLDLDVSRNTETEVNDFIIKNVKQAFQDNNNQPLPVATNIAFDGQEIYSKEHLDTKVTCKIPSFGIDTSVSTDSTTTKNYVLYKIVQTYYTAYYDSSNLSTPSKMFNLEKVDDDLIAQLNNCKAKTPIAYISEVNYGRVILLMLSSTLSVEKIKGSLKVNKFGVNVDTETNSEKERKTIDVKVTAFGGGIGAATELCSATLQDFTENKAYLDAINNLLKDNKFTAPYQAVPISYKMKFLMNNTDVVLNNSFKDVDVEDDIKIVFKAGHLGVSVNVYTRYVAPVVKNGKLQWEVYKDGNRQRLNAWGSQSVIVPARARFVQFSISPQIRGRKYTVIVDTLPLKGSMKHADGDYHELKLNISGDTAQTFSFSPAASCIEFNQDYSLYEDKKYEGEFRDCIVIKQGPRDSFHNDENFVAYLANKDFDKYRDKVKGLHPFYSPSYIDALDQQEWAEANQKK